MDARVTELRRYPVKSMLGEHLDEAEITEHGIVGDRSFALIDEETGKVCSAKRWDLWGRLFEFRAALERPGLASITFPDGSKASSNDADIDARLSEVLGRPVTLASKAPEQATIEEIWPEEKGPDLYGPKTGEHGGEAVIDVPASLGVPGGFFDLAPIHVLTTSTLAELGRLEPKSEFDVRRFRPNIVIEADDDGFVENDWKRVAIGDVRLNVFAPVPRCVMTTLAQDDLERDPGVLRAAARHNMIDALGLGTYPCVGVYAAVLTPGVVHVGDPVEVSLD